MGDPGLAALRKESLWGRRIARVVAAAVLAITMHPAAAVDGMSISAGTDDSGNANVDLYRVGVQWKWKKRWLQTENWHLGGYWDLQGGYWNNSSPDKTNSGLWELAFTPVFRVQQNELSGFAPFLEFGVGAHLISKTSVSNQRQFSTNFQFGSHVGIGARFGNKDAFELSYRYQHISNASIKHPNNGINFNILRVGYWF
jgi:lipid A 3-O-deacylase